MEIKLTTEDENKAREFIKNITTKDKTALISHSDDLDGMASAKIMGKAFNPNFIYFIKYSEFNESFIQNLKKSSINKTIFTDISITNKTLLKDLEEFSEILIIDHHQFKEDLNSGKTIFINSQGYCAANICYELFKKNPKVKKLDWLVALASTADWMYEKNTKWLKEIYQKYGDEFNIKEPRKGKLWKIIDNLALAIIYFNENPKELYNKIEDEFGNFKKLNKYSEKVRSEINYYLSNFDEQKQKISEGWFWEINPEYRILSRLSSEISLRELNKLFIIIIPYKKAYSISARRQDRKINLPELLQDLTKGFKCSSAGGHIPAAGGNFPKEYITEFKQRLKNIDLKKYKI